MNKKGVIGLLLWSLLCPMLGLSQALSTDVLVIDPGDREYSEGLYYFRDQLYIFIDSMFGPRQTDPYGLEFGEPTYGPNRIALADWDCDGDLDVLNTIWDIDYPVFPSLTFVTYLHKNLNVEEDTLLFAEGQLLEDSLFIMTHGDMDGDSDLDILSFRYYLQNIFPNCVTLPEPSFTSEQVDLEWEFSNTSSYHETACNPAKFRWDFGDGTTSEEASPTHAFPADGIYTVCLEVEDVGGWSEEAFCETISGTREKLLKETFTIAPNPATDYLELTLDGDRALDDLVINIYDATGRLAWTNHGDFRPGATQRLDVSALPNGLYTLLLRQDRGVVAKQFVVMR